MCTGIYIRTPLLAIFILKFQKIRQLLARNVANEWDLVDMRGRQTVLEKMGNNSLRSMVEWILADSCYLKDEVKEGLQIFRTGTGDEYVCVAKSDGGGDGNGFQLQAVCAPKPKSI